MSDNQEIQATENEAPSELTLLIQDVFRQGYASGLIEAQEMFANIIKATTAALIHLETSIARDAPAQLDAFHSNKHRHQFELEQMIENMTKDLDLEQSKDFCEVDLTVQQMKEEEQ